MLQTDTSSQTPLEDLAPRLRHALERRARFVQTPLFCRTVNEDGDGLPGLAIDRYDGCFVVQALSPAHDGQIGAIARLLVEIAGAGSVLARNDGPLRRVRGLPSHAPHVLHGKPPRWTRVHELGALVTVDLFSGPLTGYAYAQRSVRRVVARLAPGMRVLDLCCGVGGLFLHAGAHGARHVVAFDADEDAIVLAQENLESNGLLARSHVELADPFEALSAGHDPFELVLLDVPIDAPFLREAGALDRLLQLAIRHTQHGGFLVVAQTDLSGAGMGAFEAWVSQSCARAGRAAIVLARPALPFDFPTLLGAPRTPRLHALALELD